MFKKWLSLIVLSSFVSVAQAQDTYEVYRLPEGKLLKCNGAEYMGYDVPQFKDLLEIDRDLHTAEQVVQLQKVQLDFAMDKTVSLEKIKEKTEDQLTLVKADRDLVFKQWKDENKKRHNAEERPFLSFPSVLGWSVSIILSGVLVGVLVSK